ncbi:hypothetical protein HMPREF9088_2296 [Enterococcus italicus DSM 15952]|jgi:DNA polymerase V|uniref:Uncharacterized protein n=1 Tax=Enterococcus italicus (strain DSM 15952 / CCUG 50447 / LMG 22039 / TP 1.5) TaxID=888064 RepID=E6LIV6_ENTI1|nr:hypothetical protein HMPREF9088_2296 [Enterococcus italicus DSM 15952]
MSYPSDDPSQRGNGLILASSPAAKKAYGISNVSRSRDLPFPYPEDLVIAPPMMALYMRKNIWMLQAFIGKEALEDDDALDEDED